MNEYRNEARNIAKEARWTIFTFTPVFLAAVAILAAVGFGLKSMGLFGGTVVERKVFEQSYQRSEALKSQVATDEAALVEIERQLTNPNLDPDTRYALEAQASAARVRIATARSKQ